MKSVVILQEYVPQYRVPFFELLRSKGLERGVDIRIAYGEAGSSQAKRSDSSALSFGLPIRQVEKRIAGRRVVIRRIGQAISGADLLILEQARRNVDAYRLLAVRRSTGPLVALWGHGTDFTRQTTPIDRRVSRWLTSKADWFFAYTSAGMHHVVADGFLSAKTTVVQNSIDSSALSDSIQTVGALELQSFAAEHDLRGRTALFIGALDESKRLGFLRDAAAEIYDQEPEFRLLVAGDGAMREQVEEWAGAFSWLKYLGQASGQKKALAMASANVLSMPGRVGLVAVDSFAAGLPIVTTDWPWHAPEFEYLENGRNSVVTADNLTAYANGLLGILRSPELLIDLSDAARGASNLYSVEKMANNFIEGICQALASRQI